MQLGDQQASDNVEDRRGIGMVGGGLGVGGIVIALIAYFLGFDPSNRDGLAEQVAPQREAREAPKGAPADEMGQFVAKVLGSTEVVWGKIFQESKSQYRPPTLVLFDGQVRSTRGMAQSAVGPFYCPEDAKLYLDLAFFRDLQTRFGAPGDFAQAYVIAHQVGHHVQKLTGTFQQMEVACGRGSQTEIKQPSVRMELQADCYAGSTRRRRSGDDRVQRQTQGRVMPESFTHGSSERRVRWFKRGLESGRPKDCDTFSASSL